MNATKPAPFRAPLFFACILTLVSAASCASSNDQVARDLTKRLQDFLAAVPRGDKQVFEDFFADDVIYTRSAGVTVNKAEIIKNIGQRAANEPAMTFEADDITVHPYGNMAVVNFRLVIHSQSKDKTETTYNRNTGTFLKRNGKWQVVAWQSTKVPPEQTKAIK
ncbi:MAG TPA: nuclear transport factor 2 family protein [Candidatus Angelobacter sp.]|jgi:ketosteroid isomerase-like protein|nr:nuclear transport factor 2 family protein [Candidatus Angelobacter sp.]